MKAGAAVAASFLLGLTGCANLTAQQQANLQLELKVAQQIGQDAVKVWCQYSGTVEVIAKDAGAAGRVASVLAANTKLATDLCPSLTNPNVVVTTGS